MSEKKNLYMQINNTKKNICYLLKHREEAIEYLNKQLQEIGDNEMIYS